MSGTEPDYSTIAADIGLTALRERLPALTGTGVTVGQVEANDSGNSNGVAFEVDPASIGHPASNSDGFITYINGETRTSVYNDGTIGSYSSHASYVGTFLDSTTPDMAAPTGIAPGIAHLDNYFADNYLTNLATGYPDKVVNLSFVYDGTANEDSAYDAAALANDTVFVASAGNGGQPASPSSAYNVISVDSSTTVLAVGPASDGVPKPDISAPGIATSYTAPIVSGCAALLVQAGTDGLGGTSAQTETNAVDFRTVKALLLNGATKPSDYFTTQYAPTATQPLNAVYGSGVVDIDNSVSELQGGEQTANASYAVSNGGDAFQAFSGTPLSAIQGWNLATATTTLLHDRVDEYAIRLVAGETFIATITWASNAENKIDHFALSLFANATGTMLATSDASASNVQQIDITPTTSGIYDMTVDLEGAAAQTVSDTYALAFAESVGTACFAAGTRIATPDGDVAVERLRAGDWVETADGATRPVRFVGRRTSRPAPARPTTPIRVRRDAFGPGLPRRDLRLTEDHAIAFEIDEQLVLVPVGKIVDGETVVREFEAGPQTYYNVELDWHDVILAEGLPVESYLDTGNRQGFENAPAGSGLFTMQQPACAPLLLRGPRLTALRRRLAERRPAMV